MDETKTVIWKTEDGITIEQIMGLDMGDTERNARKIVPGVSIWTCMVIIAILFLVLVVTVLMLVSLLRTSTPIIRYYA